LSALAPTGRLAPDQRVERLPGIRHLIIVAGPSGAGKSTFVNQLLTGQLPAELVNRLPSDASRWLSLRTSAFDRWLPAILETAEKSEIPGVIADYDLTGRGILAGGTFEDDPIWVLPRLAAKTIVINLLPDAERLAGQLRQREQTRRIYHSGRPREGNPVARFLARLISAVERLFSPRLIIRFQIAVARVFPPRLMFGYRNLVKWLNVQGRPPDIEKQRLRVERKLEYYGRKGWLDEIYGKWQSHLAALGGAGANVEKIFVEPGRRERVGAHCWRVIADPAVRSAKD